MIARILVLAAIAVVAPAAPATAETNADLKVCGWQSADDGLWYDERPENVRQRVSARAMPCPRARRMVHRLGPFEKIGGWRCRTRKHEASSAWTRTVRCVMLTNSNIVLRWQKTELF